MQLTQHTDYALRMLIHLAVSPSDTWIPVRDMSERQKLSHSHLLKVANALAQHGFIETRRGAAGGLRLARDPTELTVGEVVRSMEPSFAIVECMRDPPGACALTPVCRLKGKLAEARAAFLGVLDAFTLAECAADASQARDVLGLR